MVNQYIQVEVVYQQTVVPLRILKGTIVRDIIQQAGLQLEKQHTVGIWGKRVELSTSVEQEGARVEIYRPLLCDPKQARLIRVSGPK